MYFSSHWRWSWRPGGKCSGDSGGSAMWACAASVTNSSSSTWWSSAPSTRARQSSPTFSSRTPLCRWENIPAVENWRSGSSRCSRLAPAVKCEITSWRFGARETQKCTGPSSPTGISSVSGQSVGGEVSCWLNIESTLCSSYKRNQPHSLKTISEANSISLPSPKSSEVGLYLHSDNIVVFTLGHVNSIGFCLRSI